VHGALAIMTTRHNIDLARNTRIDNNRIDAQSEQAKDKSLKQASVGWVL
jgi:hypothetical protein